MDQIAVLHQFADEGIDLVQGEWQLRAALEVAAHKVILVDAHFQRRGTGIINHYRSELLSQRKHSQDASYTDLSLALMNGLAERTYV